MAQGLFVAFEGGEGSGKDTQIDQLKKKLDPHTTVFTREPGGTAVGERIRHLLLNEHFNPAILAETEIMLFLAARAQLMEEVVRPALRAGKTVISNRFGRSTIAYQLYGRQRMHLMPLVASASEAIVGEDRPRYIYLDVTPTTGLRRVEGRGDGKNRLDAESLIFHCDVRRGYLACCTTEDFKIDADEPLDIVTANVEAALRQLGVPV